MKFFKLVECTPEEVTAIKADPRTPHLVTVTDHREQPDLAKHSETQCDMVHSETSLRGTVVAFNLHWLNPNGTAKPHPRTWD